MSGFEVVGVVLAVIPICSAILSEYASTVSAAKRFKNWQLLLSNYIRQLRKHKAHLELTTRILFVPIIPQVDVEWMLKDHDNPYWKNAAVQKQLRTRYGSLYPLFQECVGDITTSIKFLVHKLGLSTTEKVSVADLESLIASHASKSAKSIDLIDRFNFVRRKGEIAEIFSKLDRDQNCLDALIMKNDRAMKLEMEAPIIGSKGSRTALHSRARTLYTELDRVLRCQRHSSHRAGLELNYQICSQSRLLGRAAAGESYHRFGILFNQSSGWLKGEVHVCTGERMLPAHARPPPGTVVETVEEICPIITNNIQRGETIGFHLDLQAGDKLKGVYRRVEETQRWTNSDEKTSEASRTLQAMLNDSNHGGSNFTLSTRMALAVVLTSWVQQLHTTGWLLDSWSKEDIVLVAHSTKVKANTDVLNGLCPYLVHDFCPERPKQGRSVIFRLAILLMELWFGETAESYKQTMSRDFPKITDAGCLSDWIEQRGGALPDRYLAAVKLCYALDAQPDDWVASALLRIEGDLANLHRISS